MNIPVNYEQLVKILILGDSNVGKTNFLLRFAENNFIENQLTTIGFDYKSKVVSIDENRTVKLQIWDTAGQERFMSVTKNLLLRVQGVIVMYDITTKSSFENISRWIGSIRENTNDKMPIVLVGNKLDLEANRKIDIVKAKEIADEFDIHFFEASARNNINVKEAFLDLTREVLNKFTKTKEKQNLILEKEKKIKTLCC